MMYRLDQDSNLVYELVPGGKDIPVLLTNLDQFISLTKQKMLSENSLQVESIRKGINVTFTTNFLKLLSAKELETRVVGQKFISIDRLKEIS